MKRAVIVGTILGCLALFSCGVALSVFLLVTHWLAPAHARFQQELFFDYTKSEAVAGAQFCPGLEGKVRTSPPLLFLLLTHTALNLTF